MKIYVCMCAFPSFGRLCCLSLSLSTLNNIQEASVHSINCESSWTKQSRTSHRRLNRRARKPFAQLDLVRSVPEHHAPRGCCRPSPTAVALHGNTTARNHNGGGVMNGSCSRSILGKIGRMAQVWTHSEADDEQDEERQQRRPFQ